MLQSCLEGLRFLHGQQVAHGAVRAGNVLLGPGAAIRLGDFGLSVLREGTAAEGLLEHSAAPWMAPEVLEGSKPNALSDIWSIGCLMVRELDMLATVSADGPKLQQTMHGGLEDLFSACESTASYPAILFLTYVMTQQQHEAAQESL